ncbi:ImmA/IrrE family metallo-endopeptidase [Proteiniclasticum ruminis]|uniref:ImmA/IrrE family metallo-endopeptidase n=1 Tax=Proteiniclasticum ruminis TaxID=398199 RepID=UPI0028AADDBB|nr:ImmA/IrrE family metallo-endopeptidase [Proteiniclasticum ruminis]
MKFQWNRIDKKSNTPIIKNTEIDDLAEMVLKDYKPVLLKEPRKIKYEHFLESYLGANLDYQHIYYGEDEGQIFGITAFNKERLKVFDKEALRTKHILLDKHSVVLDHYITEEGREGLELFTGLHEGGHLWMHPDVYSEPEEQLSLFGSDREQIRSVTCCRRSDIENFGSQKRIRTPEEWREHQADYFASAIAMPRATFNPLVMETLRAHGITDGFVIEDAGEDEYYFVKNELTSTIVKAYGVSKTAAYVKLRKFGFVKDKKTRNEENSQFRLF